MPTIWTYLRATAVVVGSSAALLTGGIAHADPVPPAPPVPNIPQQLIASAANAPQILQNLATALGATPPVGAVRSRHHASRDSTRGRRSASRDSPGRRHPVHSRANATGGCRTRARPATPAIPGSAGFDPGADGSGTCGTTGTRPSRRLRRFRGCRCPSRRPLRPCGTRAHRPRRAGVRCRGAAGEGRHAGAAGPAGECAAADCRFRPTCRRWPPVPPRARRAAAPAPAAPCAPATASAASLLAALP